MATCDVGSHKLAMGQFWRAFEPGTFYMSNGLSSMGYGVPAAIAAQIAFPEKPVLAVVGDGGMLMMVHRPRADTRAWAADRDRGVLGSQPEPDPHRAPNGEDSHPAASISSRPISPRLQKPSASPGRRAKTLDEVSQPRWPRLG